MKKHADSKTANPAPGAEALDPAEITLILPDSPVGGFDPLPKDFAPTRPVPETNETVHPPEYRSPDGSPDETSTMAIPVKDLSQATTANIAPVLQAATQTGSESQKTAIAPKGSPTPSPKPTGSSRKLWLGLGAGVLLIAGAAAWLLWPKHQAKETSAKAAQESTQPVPEVIPPELRTYMDQAKAGDAKAMHMIALMYWNGLNIRQDRAKGLEWYHKAATAGSTAAQQFLKDNGGK